MASTLEVFFDSNKRLTAKSLVRLYKILEDKESAKTYQEIADYEMHYQVMRDYALSLLTIDITNVSKNRCRELGKFLLQAGIKIQGANPGEDLAFFEKTFELAEKGLDKVTQANALYNIGWIQCELGNLEIANNKAETGQALLAEINNDLLQANFYSLFGFISIKQGKYEDAEPYFLKSLEIYEKVLGENHPDTATSYNNLAGLYKSQVRYEDAEPFYLKALEIREKVLGENHPIQRIVTII